MKAPVVPAAVTPGIPPSPEIRRYGLLGWLLLLSGVVGFLAWAAWAPLDAGVPAPGTVVVESHRKVVAHLEGGIVREIRVHEGEWVERGDPLVVLDDAQVAPLVARLAAERRYLLAERARLEAERQGAETFDGGALPEAFGPGLVESQRRLFAARRAALRERLAQLDEEAATHQAESGIPRAGSWNCWCSSSRA